jgi:hypothetical protein
MYGSLVYSNTSINSTHGVVSIGQHTSAVYVVNLNKNDNLTIKLNEKYNVFLSHVPNGAVHQYEKIPGDYTTIEVLTANTSIAIYAVG